MEPSPLTDIGNSPFAACAPLSHSLPSQFAQIFSKPNISNVEYNGNLALRQLSLAQPTLTSADGANVEPPQSATWLTCCECGDQFQERDGLEAHVSVVHMNWQPFECVYCRSFAPTRRLLRAHVAAKHAACLFKLTATPDPHNERLLQALVQRSLAQSIVPYDPPSKQHSPQPPSKSVVESIEQAPNDVKDTVEIVEEEPTIEEIIQLIEPDVLPAKKGKRCSTAKAKGVAKKRPRGRPKKVVEEEKTKENEQTSVECGECGQTVVVRKRSDQRRELRLHVLRCRLPDEKVLQCNHCSHGNRGHVRNMKLHIERHHTTERFDDYTDRADQLSAPINRAIRLCFDKPRVQATGSDVELLQHDDQPASSSTTDSNQPVAVKNLSAKNAGKTVKLEHELAQQTNQPSTAASNKVPVINLR